MAKSANRQPNGKKCNMSHEIGSALNGRSNGRSNGRPSGLLSLVASRGVYVRAVSDQAVAERAYDRFCARGCAHGFDEEDWIAAEAELIAESYGA
jgi:hypothetical protein